jgi:hypothetical protein
MLHVKSEIIPIKSFVASMEENPSKDKFNEAIYPTGSL